jgi:hypothetical protein
MNRRRQALEALAGCLRQAPVAPVDDVTASPGWMQVIEMANDCLLTPALWSALCASGQAAALPMETCEYLDMLHRSNGRRNRALRRQAIELIGALNGSGITPALLKGGLALLDDPYGDPAVRIMRDLDVLVPVESKTEAIAVLQRLGYRVAARYAEGHHAFGDFARPNDPGCVDLHTELVDPSYVLPASEVWVRAELKQAGGTQYFSPAPTDRVMHNLLHAQIHHLGNFYRGELQLQQLYELVALVGHFGAEVDWLFVQQRMRTHRLTAALESYLLAAHRLLGLEWPLESPPTFAARLHCRRCEVQFGVALLGPPSVFWGNLRGALAWHRMRALHGRAGGPLRWRCRHMLQYVRRRGVTAGFARLRRVY